MKERSKQVLKKQRQFFFVIFVGVGLCVLGLGYLVMHNQTRISKNQQAQNIDLPADKMNPQDIWMGRIESQSKLLEQKIKYLEETITSNKKQEEHLEKEKRLLKQDVDQLRTELRKTIQHAFSENPSSESPNTDPFFESIEKALPDPAYVPLVEVVMEVLVQKPKNDEKIKIHPSERGFSMGFNFHKIGKNVFLHQSLHTGLICWPV